MINVKKGGFWSLGIMIDVVKFGKHHLKSNTWDLKEEEEP